MTMNHRFGTLRWFPRAGDRQATWSQWFRHLGCGRCQRSFIHVLREQRVL